MSLKQNIIGKIKAIHWVYILLHIILLIIGFFLVIYGSILPNGTILIGIGGSLIAGAIAGIVLFVHVWLEREEFHRMEIIRKFGLLEVFKGRAVLIKQKYDDRLSNVSRNIDIMGFGLRSLKEDYSKEFNKWAARAEVRILMLDPEFPNAECSIADIRDKEENTNKGKIKQDVRAFINECAALLKNNSSQFKVRLYRCLPSINIFRIDDELFWGPYLIGSASRNFPTLLLNEQGILFKRLLEHFEEIWTNDQFSRDIPNEWLKHNESMD